MKPSSLVVSLNDDDCAMIMEGNDEKHEDMNGGESDGD